MIKKKSDIKESALRLLARREHGEKELKRKLLQRGYELDAIEEVIEWLIKLDLQSDLRFVESYIRRRSAKHFGPLHIAHELSITGIDKKMISEALTFYKNEWLEIIRQMSEKKFGVRHFFLESEKKQRQIRFFQYRGFDQNQILVALSTVENL